MTDSTGKNQLWENCFLIPYKSEDGRAPRPFSVSASPDSGFTVVGEYNCTKPNGGYNGFAAHFVPRLPVSAVPRISYTYSAISPVRVSVSGSRVVFTMPLQRAGEKISVEVFDGVGRRVALVNGNRSAVWDAKSCGVGIYFWKSVGSGVKECGVFVSK